MNPLIHHTRRLMLAAATAASLLAACGGGDGLGSGGTGSSPETFAVGTVDGFGSIFIGGERCDHVGARVAWDTFTGGPEEAADPNPDIKLGQRVEVELQGGDLCRIVAARIAPELIGVVSATSPDLVVAGAKVLVNTDPAAGAVTVFDGYGGAADITVGDRVEVHGKAVPHGSGVAIQATRIERKPTDPTWVRVAGVISNLTANTFNLGGLTVHYDSGTTIVPTGFVLRDGLTIAMWSTGAVTGNDINARYIRVLRRQFADQQKVRVQGPIRGCNGANPCTEFSVDGIDVLITRDTVFRGNATVADIADGKTVHVRGTFDATSGKLVARAVAVRLASDGVITLLGSVSDFTTDGTTTFFRVRGVPVSTTANTQYGPNCAAKPIGEGTIVAVAGQISGSTVVAEGIACPQLAVGTVIDAYGAISQLDATAKTFHISNRPLLSLATMQWDDNTVFSNGASPASLANGQYVGVRGVYQGNGKFLLLRVVLDDTPPPSPTGVVFSAIGIAHHVNASSMWVNLVPMAITPASTVTPGVVNGALVRAWFYRDVPNARWVVIYAHPVSW